MSKMNKGKGNQLGQDRKMNPIVFWPPVIILSAFVIVGAIATGAVGNVMTKLL